jgi:hypothetical protein
MGQHIGDKEVLMGWCFWVGCGFFSWGTGGREDSGNSRSSTAVSCSQDDTSFRTSLFMLYHSIIYGTVGVSLQHTSRPS